jgi:hypothetical protein
MLNKKSHAFNGSQENLYIKFTAIALRLMTRFQKQVRPIRTGGSVDDLIGRRSRAL